MYYGDCSIGICSRHMHSVKPLVVWQISPPSIYPIMSLTEIVPTRDGITEDAESVLDMSRQRHNVWRVGCMQCYGQCEWSIVNIHTVITGNINATTLCNSHFMNRLLNTCSAFWFSILAGNYCRKCFLPVLPSTLPMPAKYAVSVFQPSCFICKSSCLLNSECNEWFSFQASYGS